MITLKYGDYEMENKLKNIIKQARETMGISQRELARRINIDNSVISRIEDGTILQPKYDTLLKLSEELNLDKIKLFSLVYQDEYDEKLLKYLDDIDVIMSHLGYYESIKKYMKVKKGVEYVELVNVFKDHRKGLLNDIEVMAIIMYCMRLGDRGNQIMPTKEEFYN